MRDRKRIKRILEKIEKLWRRTPDMRLNQLLICFGNFPDGGWSLEDDEVEKALDKVIKEEKEMRK